MDGIIQKPKSQFDFQSKPFEALLDAAPIMMGTVELAGNDLIHLASNTRSAAFFGKTPSELHRIRASDLGIPPDLIAQWITNNREAERTGHPVRFEFSVDPDQKRGGRSWYSATVNFLNYSSNRMPQFIYMVEDITASRLAQDELERRIQERTEELERANRRLRAEIQNREILETERDRLYNLPNHLLCVLDDEGRFRSVNLGFTHILGYSPEELIGTFIWDYIHPEDLLRSKEVEQVSRTTVIQSFENRCRARDGTYRWLRWTGTIIKGINYGAGIDITELKSIEANLKENLTARDEFLSIASHELKTPLTSLKLQAQNSMRAIQKNDTRVFQPERVRTFVEQTERQVSRLARLVDDMLDISRIRTGKMALTFETVDLNALIEDVIERLQPSFVEALTPCDFIQKDHITGYWDRFRIEQVITNLLTNAMRYGQKKSIHLVLSSKDADHALIALRDQGIGIAPESRDKIFSRFERAVSANEISGLGLGLYISREIVHAHDGRIWAESPGLGQGSTFFVELPLQSVRS